MNGNDSKSKIREKYLDKNLICTQSITFPISQYSLAHMEKFMFVKKLDIGIITGCSTVILVKYHHTVYNQCAFYVLKLKSRLLYLGEGSAYNAAVRTS